MKKVEPISICSGDGTTKVPTDTYYRWNKTVAGKDFEFALHADPSTHAPRKLFISEVSTGATLGLGPVSPKYGKQLTESAFSKSHSTYLPGSRIKHLARATLHNALGRVGHEKFLESIDMATFQIMAAQSKTLMDTLRKEGLTMLGGVSGEDPQELLNMLHAARGKLEEEWDITQRTPEELDALDGQMAEIDDAISQLENSPLQLLRARLTALTEQREQHGTMTGDTTDADFEDICDNIVTLECEIAELEKAHAKPD